jgi:hypothetical protein
MAPGESTKTWIPLVLRSALRVPPRQVDLVDTEALRGPSAAD